MNRPDTRAPKTPALGGLSWLGLLLLFPLVASAGYFLRLADRAKPTDWNESRLTYLPSGKVLRPAVLDFDEAVADMLWIRSMIYFADAYLEGKSYKWLGHMLDVITTLNPRFKPAYEFTGSVLSKEKSELPKTMRILERGVAEFPKDWRLRVSASLGQLALDSDYVKAAEFIEPVTLDSGVPPHIRTLAATFLTKGGGEKMALAYLVDRYIRSQNAINREIFLNKILKLYPKEVRDRDPQSRSIVTKVLFEASLAPEMVEQVALGVIHEYLSGAPSPQTTQLIDMLRE